MLASRLRHGLCLALCSAIPCGARAAAADAPRALTLSAADVVTVTLSRNPTVAATLCERQSSALAVQGEAARYGFVLQLDTSWTHLAIPTLAAGRAGDGSVTTGDQNTINAGAQLKKHLIYGTDLALRFDASRQSTNSFFSLGSLGPIAPIFPSAGPDGTIETHLGPGYGAALKLSAVQPLLRGAGQTVAESDLRIARVNLTTAELVRNRTASDVVREALTAYWESWYASAAVDIERRSLALARSEHEDAAARIRTGSLAPVEGLTFATQVASRSEDVVNAEAERRRRLADLARVLGLAEQWELITIPLEVSTETAVSGGNALEDALAASPELRALESQVKLASVQAEAAGDAFRPRLDLDAYVQAQGLGYNDVPAAWRQFSSMGAVSAHVGLTFELPLDDTQHRTQRQRAFLAVETARYKLNEGKQQLVANLELSTQREDAARQRVDLARQTLEVARQRAEAEHKRFSTGSSTALQVMDAENATRSAELRVARARADLTQAHISVAHLTGHLLRETSAGLERADALGCGRRAPLDARLGFAPTL
jgi:outer membrane protein